MTIIPKAILFQIAFIAVFANLGFSQNQDYIKYNKLITSAYQQADSLNYEQAFLKYDSAFAIINYIPYTYFSAFRYAVRSNNNKKAYEYLLKGTTKGLDLDKWYPAEVEQFKKSHYINLYNNKKDSLFAIYYKSIDYETYLRLERLIKRDQSIRKVGNKQMLINDSLNFDELIDITMKTGFPTFEKLGYGHNKAALLLWHHRDDYPNSQKWKIIIPYIEKEIYNGKVDPKFLIHFDEFIEQSTEGKKI